MKELLKLICLILLVSAVQAQSLSVIDLQHRPAEEVIPIVQPFLGANDAISGEGFRIFLQSSPDTLARVRQMIDVLDIPAKILQVSVFQGDERDIHDLAASAGIQIERGDVSVDIGDSSKEGDTAGGGIAYSTSGGSASLDGISTQKNLRDNPIHRVRVAEGTEAYIETGKRIPYFYSSAWLGAEVFAGAVEYKDAVTGFYVLPRVRGDNVILEVSPFKSSLNDSGVGGIDTQSANTVISGRIGQWLPIGGVTEQFERTQNTTGNKIATHSRSNSGIWVRADLVQ